MSSAGGVDDEKILALDAHADSERFTAREKAALAYADAMTFTDRDVGDEQFERLREHFDEDEIVALTAVIAWENASARFNRALRIGSQGLWKRSPDPRGG